MSQEQPESTPLFRVTPIEAMTDELRQEWRIKLGCDYALTHKYSETRLLASTAFLETIQEIAEKHGVKFAAVFTY